MTIQSIDVNTLKSWLDANDALLIDVREPAEHSAQAIKEATLLPLSHFSPDQLPSTMGRKMVIHCKSGARSLKVCQQIVSQEPNTQVYNLEGGIIAWAQAGFATLESSSRTVLALDQQVQLTIGLCVFIGAILGYFISSYFIAIPAFFGAGLIFAGATGYCGLAKLIGRMPWNQ